MANLQLIKTIAEQRKMPITELASRVGVSEQQIHLMARTNSTKINTLEKIAKVLEVPVTIFFDDQPHMIENYRASGKHGFVAKHVGSVDNRDMIEVKDKVTEVESVSEEIILPSDCQDKTNQHLVDILTMENNLLRKLLISTENQLEEKERFISHLLGSNKNKV